MASSAASQNPSAPNTSADFSSSSQQQHTLSAGGGGGNNALANPACSSSSSSSITASDAASNIGTSAILNRLKEIESNNQALQATIDRMKGESNSKEEKIKALSADKRKVCVCILASFFFLKYIEAVCVPLSDNISGSTSSSSSSSSSSSFFDATGYGTDDRDRNRQLAQ
jgi:hypothetical protein